MLVASYTKVSWDFGVASEMDPINVASRDAIFWLDNKPETLYSHVHQ